MKPIKTIQHLVKRIEKLSAHIKTKTSKIVKTYQNIERKQTQTNQIKNHRKQIKHESRPNQNKEKQIE